jgi:hypothetical protein
MVHELSPNIPEDKKPLVADKVAGILEAMNKVFGATPTSSKRGRKRHE